MAYECPILDLSFPAGVDLSGGQYLPVKLNAQNRLVACTVAGELALGILQNAPKAGEEGGVRLAGVSKAVIEPGVAVNAMAELGVTAGGRLGAAATGHRVVAMTFEAVTGSTPAGILGTVELKPGYPKP